MIEPDRLHMTVQYDAEMLFACQVNTARIHTHSLHLLLIAFAQHRLLEHGPMLHYTYITCLVNNNVLFIKTLYSLIFYASA